MAKPDKRTRRAAKKKKVAKRKAAKQTAPPKPRDEAYNYWVNFVLYAVVGLTAQADGLLARHGEDIRTVAAWLRHTLKLRLGTLYRGIVVEPEKIEDHWLEHEEERKFLSWSEDRQVACWFADPRSVISELVHQMYPRALGYITAGKLPRDKVLWHYAWTRIPLPNGHTLPLEFAAAAHPEIDEGQFAWNLRTQEEVITDAPKRGGTKLHVDLVTEDDCGETAELDSRYAYPPFLISRGFGG